MVINLLRELLFQEIVKMHTQMNLGRPQWTSSMGYLLVTIGAVVGIGNIFLFPFLVFKYGGLFVLFYLLCEVALAVPLLYAELMLGRRGKQNPVGAVELLAFEKKAAPFWQKLGWLYFVITFLTFSYYIVYAALPMGLLMDSVRMLYISEIRPNTVGSLTILGSHLLTNFYVLEACVVILLLSAIVVVARGINRGLEKMSRVTVPIYFFILVGLAIYVVLTGHAVTALKNIFTIKPELPIFVTFFAALTLAFLKFNVGMGSMIIYGSYLPYATSLKRSTLLIILFDLIISFLAYFVTYELAQPLNPALFMDQLTAGSVMVIFGHPYGVIMFILFFFAAFIASWTVLIAMLEVMVSTVSERFNILRSQVAWWVGGALLLLASFIVICQTTRIDEIYLGHIDYPYWLREIALGKLTPIAVFFMAIFAGWIVDRSVSMAELNFKPWLYAMWRFLIRYLIPVLIVIIFIYDIAN
jgi:NSS family neurotransmitter:Na+ symporter